MDYFFLKPTEIRQQASPLQRFVIDLWHFFLMNAWSCTFPVLIFVLLAITQIAPLPFLPRYDWLLIFILIIQWVFVKLKFETHDELKVIVLFHLMGLGMELFKVWKGSWSYPETGFSKIGGVPLYSGFMYACVAGYMCQAWRKMELKLVGHVPHYWGLAVAVAIYLNFFTLHFIVDMRYFLALLAILIYRSVDVQFKLKTATYQIPMLLAFVLIGFFIWLAENIATFLGAWKYAYQHENWQAVSTQKLGSWILMVIVSFIIVAELKHFKAKKRMENGELKIESLAP